MKIINKILFITVVLVLLATVNLYPQAQRKVLFEEATSCFCGPCGQSNPIFDSWFVQNQANANAIKYHPNFGADPMYLANPTQNTERVQYCGINAYPTINADGVLFDCCWPFSASCFTSVVNQRIAVPTPLSITVTDTRIPGDSIKTVVVVTLSSNLPSGNYKLRVMAIEGHVHYATPPGSNGETDFYQVFRWAYPNTTGVNAPTTTGTYSFEYRYKILSNWQDTSIYTIAFVQNDVNKEVINSGRGVYIPTGITNLNSEIPGEYFLNQNYPNPFNPVTKISFGIPKSENVSLKIYDMLGNLVYALYDGKLPAGTYSYDFNGSELSSGIYFYILKAGNFSQTKKLMLIK